MKKLKDELFKIESLFKWYEEPLEKVKYFECYLISLFEKKHRENIQNSNEASFYYEIEEKREKYLVYERKWLDFFSNLKDTFQIYLIRYTENNTIPFDRENIIFFEFQDGNEYLEYLRSTLRNRSWTEGSFFVIGPLLSALYISFDLEVILFERIKSKKLNKLILNSGFSIL